MIREGFAGPGGWDEGLKILGHSERTVGIEWDLLACETARQAGHERVHADVRKVKVHPITGQIDSPPCQTYAQSGDGSGVEHMSKLELAVARVAAGVPPEEAVLTDEHLDERTVLALHPLTVTRDHRPRWVALEQVPPVLPLWMAYVKALRTLGYHARADYLNSEQFGVPQARKRAVLVAVRDDVADEVPWATPTHSLYHRRDPARLDPGVLPWVSMAEALGWDRTGQAPAAVPGDTTWVYRRPSPTIVGSFRPDIVAAPGYRRAGDPPRQRTPGSVLVTPEQAGVLQSFRADYPWQGTQSEQFRQIGDAIPPLMAAAILRDLVTL